jgi:hypothetical protein
VRWIVLLIACATPPPAHVSTPDGRTQLPFIEDDYPRARAEARASKLPLFVEAWAPW